MTDKFDDNFVMSQLLSTGSIAYQQLMRIGYPDQINIDELLNRFKESSELSSHITKNQKHFFNTLLRSCGLRFMDFRIGNTNIFFRNGKINLLMEKINDDVDIIMNRYMRLKFLRNKWRVTVIGIILARMIVAKFCPKRRSNDCSIHLPLNSTVNENTVKVNPKLQNNKRKLDTSSDSRSI